MAVVRNLATSSEITGNPINTNWTSGSFEATAGQLMVVVIQRQISLGAYSDPENTISSSGMTFTHQVGNYLVGSASPPYIDIHTAIVPSSGSRTVTVNNPSSENYRGWVQVFLYDNVDQTTPVRQVVEHTLDKDTQNNGSYSFNLSSAPLSTSEVLVGAVQDTASYGDTLPISPGTGWTAILNDWYTNAGGDYGGINLIARNGSTSQSISYDDLDTNDTGDVYLDIAFAGIEIAEAAPTVNKRTFSVISI